MAFESLKLFNETKDLGEPDAGPEGIQRKDRRLFGIRGSSRLNSGALD